MLLIYNVEYLIAFCCSGTSSAIVEGRTHSAISFGGVGFILIEGLILCSLWPYIRCSHFVHEIAVEHGLSHLLCVVGYLVYLASRAEAICLCLVENWLILVDCWKHLMNT